ncbi:MAG: efflux RND transporter periplasmic adaptor subunit [Pseudomarimonas sp.]
MKTTTRKLSLALAIALATSMAAVLSVHAQDEPTAAVVPAVPATPVGVMTAQTSQFAPLLWAPGNVVSREDARVASEQEGRVIAVAEVGTQLRKGEPLARLDDRMLRLQIRQAESDVARIQAQLDYAHSQEQRLGQLVEKASIAGAQLDEARSQRRVLEQDLQRANVSVEQSRQRLLNSTVRAPFDGMVAERFIQIGEYLGTGTAVARLVNTQRLEVRAQAPVNLAAGLAPGMSLSLREGSNETVQKVRAVVPVGDESSRQIELRIELDSSLWAIGSALQVGLPSAAPREVVAVPRDALLLRADQTYVVRINAELIAQRVPVETGGTQGDWVEVTGDIASGDRLVVRGGERLADGANVRIDEIAALEATVAGRGS